MFWFDYYNYFLLVSFPPSFCRYMDKKLQSKFSSSRVCFSYSLSYFFLFLLSSGKIGLRNGFLVICFSFVFLKVENLSVLLFSFEVLKFDLKFLLLLIIVYFSTQRNRMNCLYVMCES